MKFNFLAAPGTIGALMFGLCACAGLPDGAQKPELEIAAVSLATADRAADAAGADADAAPETALRLELRLRHASPEPLLIRRINVSVNINGRPAAQYREEPDDLAIPERRTVRLVRRVPLNLALPVGRASLTNTAMLFVRADCRVLVCFDPDAEDGGFNPQAEFSGVISRDPR